MVEPEDLTLRMLGDIRSILDKHTEAHARHDRDFESLKGEMREWQETIAMASGYSVHANWRNQQLTHEVAELRRRIEALEQVK